MKNVWLRLSVTKIHKLKLQRDSHQNLSINSMTFDETERHPVTILPPSSTTGPICQDVGVWRNSRQSARILVSIVAYRAPCMRCTYRPMLVSAFAIVKSVRETGRSYPKFQRNFSTDTTNKRILRLLIARPMSLSVGDTAKYWQAYWQMAGRACAVAFAIRGTPIGVTHCASHCGDR